MEKKLFDLESYLDQAERDFVLTGQDHFQFRLRLSEEMKARHQELESALKAIAEIKIDFANRRIQGFTQGVPCGISFRLEFLFKKRPQALAIRQSFQSAIAAAPGLKVEFLLAARYQDCHRRHHALREAAEVAQYVVSNLDKIKGLYPRQISHGQSTKLLESDPFVAGLLKEHLGLPTTEASEILLALGLKNKPLTFSFFATEVEIDGKSHTRLPGTLCVTSIHRYNFPENCRILIVENEETFAALSEVVKDTLLIFGAGKRAYGMSFLQNQFKQPVFYSGDIDKEGYEICDFLLKIFPTLQTVAMDFETIRAHSNISWVKSKPGSPSKNLSIHHQEYEYVCRNGLLLEQEKFPLSVFSKFI